MATRGVFQLQKLWVFYCEHGGSSKAVREYLGAGKLVEWATEHPHVDIILKPRNGKHPYVRGIYKTQATAHQVCIRNSTPEEIGQVMDKLHNRSGRKIKKLVKPVVTQTQSVQGVWTPMLDLRNKPFPVRFVE